MELNMQVEAAKALLANEGIVPLESVMLKDLDGEVRTWQGMSALTVEHHVDPQIPEVAFLTISLIDDSNGDDNLREMVIGFALDRDALIHVLQS